MFDYIIVYLIIRFYVKDNVSRGYKFSVIHGIILIINIFLYTVIVELFKYFGSTSQQTENQDLVYIFLFLAIGEFLAIKFGRKFMIGKIREQVKMQEESMRRKGIVQGFLVIDILTFALCEVIVIYGLLLFLLTYNATNFYIFLILGLISLGIYFPRYSKWKETAESFESHDNIL